MRQPFRIAVFASGSGTNFQAIVDAVASGKLDVIVELLVCDQPQAAVVERAKLAGVNAFVFRPKDYASRDLYEVEIIAELESRQIDLIVMAGYMRLITDTLVKPYYGKIINIHPSLLPAFPGVNGIGDAFEYGVKLTGVTVHFVDGGMDSGPIIAQQSVEVLADDTQASLAERIHAIEHKLYPQTIALIREGRIHLDERKVSIK
ncbi:MAG: phosphoribosylglycinamide formyltransferase [Paenibacillaceae bacterium]